MQHDPEREKWTTPHPDERSRRIFDTARASKLMAEAGMDVLLATSMQNVNYITDYYYAEGAPDFMMEDGLNFYDAYVGVPREDPEQAFITGCTGEEGYLAWKDPWVKDRRFWGAFFPVVDGGSVTKLKHDPVPVVIEALQEKGLAEGTIGVEMRFIKHDHFEQFRQALPKARFVDVEPLLWQMRRVKTAEEISRSRVASRAVSKALEHCFRNAHAGMSEMDMAREVTNRLRDEQVFLVNTLVAFGPKGGYVVQHTPNRLREGELMRMDITARYRGYATDISRVAAFGAVSQDVVRACRAIQRANEALREATKPGVRGVELRKLELAIMKEEKLDLLLPMAGHGLGRIIHEPPFMTDDDESVIEPGMVLAIELALRMAHVGSVNIEDTVVVTEDGNESLTTAPRDLFGFA
jgi:Xaa-Pro aminopeptidase